VIRKVPGRAPRIHPDTWIDPSAQVIGDVIIEEGIFRGTQNGVFRTPTGDVPPTGRRVQGEPRRVREPYQGRAPPQTPGRCSPPHP